jgi:hypothetical protein
VHSNAPATSGPSGASAIAIVARTLSTRRTRASGVILRRYETTTESVIGIASADGRIEAVST